MSFGMHINNQTIMAHNKFLICSGTLTYKMHKEGS